MKLIRHKSRHWSRLELARLPYTFAKFVCSRNLKIPPIRNTYYKRILANKCVTYDTGIKKSITPMVHIYLRFVDDKNVHLTILFCAPTIRFNKMHSRYGHRTNNFCLGTSDKTPQEYCKNFHFYYSMQNSDQILLKKKFNLIDRYHKTSIMPVLYSLMFLCVELSCSYCSNRFREPITILHINDNHISMCCSI